MRGFECIMFSRNIVQEVLQHWSTSHVAGQENYLGQCVQACPQLETCRTCTGLGWPTALQGACAITATSPQGQALLMYFYSLNYSDKHLQPLSQLLNAWSL